MYSASEWLRLFSFAVLIGHVVLLARLFITGLARVYRCFSALLFCESILTSLLLAVRPHSNMYAVVWACSKPVEWILGLAVVLEIYSLVLHRYPGIASLTRWAILAGVMVSLLLSVASLSLDFHNPNEKFPILRLAFAVQRTVDNTLVWALLMPWFLLTRFPIRLCRNVVVHCFLFSAFMGIESGGLFARNLLGTGWSNVTNFAMLAGTTLCLLGWILLIGRDGERAEGVVLARIDPEREHRLIGQLKSFNVLLMRATPQGAR